MLPIILLFTAAGSQAATIFTTDLSEFVSKLQPGYQAQTFNSLAVDKELTSPLNLSSGPFSYSAATGKTFFNADNGGGDVVFSTTFSDDPITFTFTSGNVTAVGGYFWNTDADFGVVPETLSFALSDGTTATSFSAGPGSFFGFYSDKPIDWIRITPEYALYTTVNDLYVGSSVPEPPSDVPEPASISGVLGGLLALTLFRRRLRRS